MKGMSGTSRRQKKTPGSHVPRKSKSRPQGSFIRRRLVGPTPLEQLDPKACQFVQDAIELDELLLKRGWTFKPDPLPSCLEWTWPATPGGHTAEILDDEYGHELKTVTTVGYYFDRHEPQEVAVSMAGGCGWGSDMLLPQEDFIADIERYEAHWVPDRSQHACPAAGVVFDWIEPKRAERENLIGTGGPLPFPVSLIDERSEQIARAHPGSLAPTVRKMMGLLPVVIQDRRGSNNVYTDPHFAEPFAVVTWAEAVGDITWDQSSQVYRCNDPSALWGNLVEEFHDLVDAAHQPGPGDT